MTQELTPENFEMQFYATKDDHSTLLRENNYDTFWKFVSEYHLETLVNHLLAENGAKYDLESMQLINKELQLVTLEDLPYPKKNVDKLIEIRHKEGKDKMLKILIEFQTVAKKEFPQRMARYMNSLIANNSCEILSYAIISHTSWKQYKNQYIFGSSKNGATFTYEGHVIKDMPETKFADDTCLISQLYHAIWIKEHQREFLKKEIEEKYIKIIKNIISYDFNDLKYYSTLLFILKYAQNCSAFRKSFRNFIQKINYLTPKNIKMDFVDLFIQEKEKGLAEGEARGLAKGEARGIAKGEARAEARNQVRVQQIAKELLRVSAMTLEQIAEITKLDINQLRRLKGSK
ncbi:RpnC/YadD family protein [Arachidicoccus terrestris]|uniref:hypothetical protein n=1 Tax=Arachidicoccus terrestris TaxID=2875539 RepID=UPI001CC554EA|nr:hypothetical protein [Arachidicoccus terrestris]UAY55567.1 hypothetical protein K9M52_00600 [Arachidicoccus terrestris]